MSAWGELFVLFALPLWLGVFLVARRRLRAAGAWTSVVIAVICSNVTVIVLGIVIIMLRVMLRALAR